MPVNNALWVTFIIILGLDLFFVAMRASLLHVRQPYLVALRDRFPERVDQLFKLLENPYLRVDMHMGVVGMHFLLAGITWILLHAVTRIEFTALLAVASLLAIVLLVLLVEFALEGLILKDIEKWAIRFTRPAGWIDTLFRPVAWVLMKLLGPPSVVQAIFDPVIEDELKNWVRVAKEEGGLDTEERKLIYSVFQFGETLCREIMVPRIDMFTLDVSTPVDEAIKAVITSGHSRIPVYEETIDNIIGFLYVKDLLKVSTDCNKETKIQDMLRPAQFVPEAKRVSELLREMQIREVHAVIVVDEYGGTAGIVTLEDIVEEIVGEIRDEYDHAEESLYQKISEDEYIFQGRIDIDDFNDILNTHLTRDVADSLGGYIYGEIGRVPLEGEKIEVEGWELIVEQVSRRRIRNVRVKRAAGYAETEDENNHGEPGNEG